MAVKEEPIVYVVQNQHKLDRDTNRLVPKFDMKAAEGFGRLVYLLSPTAAPFHPDPVVKELRLKLKDYRTGDHLLLVGNPALILAVGCIAATYNEGRVSVLQWSGRDRRYVAIEMDGLDTAFDFTP